MAPTERGGAGHVAVVGSTASGKSSLALDLATGDDRWEIVTVDSMQVYRGMDIGTAKPTPDEQAQVPHHLLDLADPWDDFDLATYQTAAKQALTEIESRGHRALLVGGTALYLRAVIDDLDLPGRFPEVRAEIEAVEPTEELHRRLVELDPVAAARMEPNNRRRVVRALEVTIGAGRPFSSFGPGLDDHPPIDTRVVALTWPRDELDSRIEERFAAQMERGFLDEVRERLEDPRGMSRTAGQALGYKELAEHLCGELSLDEAVDLAVRRTRRFSRRQEKWFRRDPRIDWIDATGPDPAARVRGLVQ